ncbi:CLUMA_CG014219, isoform A [Clunio marinus]|uniref:CLUMA_CG014219, isoform A n=1 Tax=Clunio marinus TaxID=568069 RepID=A0A1J1IRH0_9DIPT|nr:CLUMA_CG014219, isoform A [Clunio marinus]
MKKLEQLILPVVLLSVLTIKTGNGLDCYTCDSTVNPDCLDVKDSKTLDPVTCRPSVIGDGVGIWLKEIIKIDFFDAGEVSVPMLCQKIVATNEQGDKHTFRGCQLDGGKTNVCDTITNKAAKTKIKITECITCKEDKCNKTTSLHHVNPLLFLVPLVLITNFIRNFFK